MSGQKKMFAYAVLMCLALVVFFGVSSMARAEKLKEYSAEQFVIQKGKEQQAGKIYVSNNKMRMDHTMPGQREEMRIIVRQDKKLTWTIFPDKKKYIQSTLTEEDMKNPAGISGHGGMNIKTREENLSSETINGYPCQKKRIESTMQMMGREITGRSTVWISDQLDFPIRTENEGGTITELRNINPGDQDDRLFELPAGFVKAADMMEVMNEGFRENEDPEEGAQPAMPEQMPEEMRKMIEEQMGKQNR